LNSNNDSILLTVIIFSYNHEDHIAQAVDSVLEQETVYPYEIWLCDDCSTDGTTTICADYAKKYPDKIKLFAQPVNTYSDKITHFEITLKKVDTKYLSILEGDDVWCDDNKIQIALDFLEGNPQYVTFALDTLFNDVVNGTKRSLVHEVYKTEIQNPVTFENALYLHTSSRIHRNVVRFSEGRDAYADLFLFYIFLDKGPLYYYDKIMSVYNITGKGVWSSLSETDVKKTLDLQLYKLNGFFNYKYEAFFTSRLGEPKTLEILKKIFGVKPGWEHWYDLMFEESDKNLDQLKIISELQKSQQALSRMPLASEDLTIEKIEGNILALNEYYLSKDLPDVILLFENTSKINAHLVAANLYLRHGRYRRALSHLFRIAKMDLPILFSIQTIKIIANGLIFHLRRN